MTYSSSVAIETAKRLSVEQELEIHRAAHARAPDSPLIRTRLANLMVQADRFEEAIGLLDERADLSFVEAMLLIQALLAAETPATNRRVCAVAAAAADLADSDEASAALLADLAKAQARLGDPAARATLTRALTLDPANKNACKRLASSLFAAGDPQAVLDFTEACAARGAAHSRLFAAQVLALARLGRSDEARQRDGRGALGMVCQLPPPPGWDSIAAFNAALAAQLLAHSGLRFERYGTASEQTWRVDTPNTPDAPLVGVLLGQLRAQIDRHLAALTGQDHPWLAALPDQSMLHCWCVITDGTGHETWHVHQFGWLSGVYYVAMPEVPDNPGDHGGCLAFGLPPEVVGDAAAAAFGLEINRPVPGEMRVFPSHTYHRTYPHHRPSRRICIAFDLLPS